jgi:hypothetical protein
MTTSKQVADALLREWQRGRGRDVASEHPSDSEEINHDKVTLPTVQAGLVLCAFLVSLRQELSARKDTGTRAKRRVREQASQIGGAI